MEVPKLTCKSHQWPQKIQASPSRTWKGSSGGKRQQGKWKWGLWVGKKRNFRNEKLSETNNNRVESITNRLSQTVKRMSGIEGKVKEIPNSNTSKEKKIKTTVTVSRTSGLHTEIRPKNTCDGRRNLDNHRREKISNKILTENPKSVGKNIPKQKWR